MVKGLGVPGRRPRTHAPKGWPGPVDFSIDPGRSRRNTLTLLIFAGVGFVAYFAFGGGQVLGWGLAVLILALAAGSMVRVQGEPSAVRLTREGVEFVGTRPPKRIRWDEVTDIDLVDMPTGLGLRPGKPSDRVIRLMLAPTRRHGPPGFEIIPTGAGADLDGLAWEIEGWQRYATRPW